MKEVLTYENDIPAKEQTEIKSTRLQKENEHC
jgi:hypothetical protein